ncbi:kinetochore-associated protein KNL-2 homolog isoform X2 [Andrographis paniculata]|uniref:kinetochore-associated protein KNL-2 homolog isoform X2 n=1 Tax=Andrographis paniculata TaxID=175694 RepID=UPI0021E6E074|nr:kinetochore-associated protein KNL-2 homolog isoform X2 [Andrographis paniculata]
MKNLQEQAGAASSSRLMSCTRSRSGRLFMPTLEFWRNERAIYNVDRTVTGFQESIRLEELRKGTVEVDQSLQERDK